MRASRVKLRDRFTETVLEAVDGLVWGAIVRMDLIMGRGRHDRSEFSQETPNGVGQGRQKSRL